MPLPHVVARGNKRCTNWFIEPLVRRSGRFIRVRHVGRRSGTPYSTPLYGFSDSRSTVVVLTYGPRADWVQNVRAGAASIERDGDVQRIESLELVEREAAWPILPSVVRSGVRILRVTQFARLTPVQPTAVSS